MSCAQVAIMVSFSSLLSLLRRIRTCIMSIIFLPLWIKRTYHSGFFFSSLQPSGFQPPSLRTHTMAYHNRSWPQTSGNSSSSGASPNPHSHQPTPISASSYSSRYTLHSRAPTARNGVSEIVPRVYISDLCFAENPNLLASYHITHILSVLPETVSKPDPAILGYTPIRLQINVEDLPFAELAAHLPTTTQFIHDALRLNPEARILIHCVEGISRSASVVAAFLMAQYGWTPNEAVRYVMEKRKIANPNFGFVKQLYEYAREGLGRRGLVEGM